jgi:hypothetical protein
MSDKPAVLFVCIHNAGRSQMAAGYLASLGQGRIEVRSAGSLPGAQVFLADGYFRERGIRNKATWCTSPRCPARSPADRLRPIGRDAGGPEGHGGG